MPYQEEHLREGNLLRKMLVEEYLGKDKKLYAAFMDLKKAYDRVDREALWSVLKTVQQISG